MLARPLLIESSENLLKLCKVDFKKFKEKEKNMEQFIQQNLWILILLTLWTTPWKGWALWKSARLNDKGWFIVLLVINTLAILEILYIFIVSKRKKSVELT